ncbi:MAG: HAMP domain-containing protein [Acidobacteria bacterium]|jgi:two-component system sensor histidine kinase CpxA|nr:HAMP domain-containing protein [Acidobacteriota bacterium]
MRSLFLKIFLSYWLAQALFVVLAILITLAVRQRSESATTETKTKILNESVQAYEQGGEAAVRKYLEDIRESEQLRVYLFDARGQEVTGRPVPGWADDTQRNIPIPRRDLLQYLTPSPFQRQTLATPEGHRYIMVVMLPPGPFGPRGVPGLGILIGVVSSGIVCYFLAVYLARPIVRLRSATQRLAEGDLTARAGGLGKRRGDEIAQLVRDFDAMAERLETLVNAQSRLLKDISHELRSPLARLNVALALARQRSGAEAQGALERIDLEANRLNGMIERLLTIARLESGVDNLRQGAVRLGDLVREIVEDADFEAQGRGCHVSAMVVDDCTVTGNPALLHSAIENVVRNATRYTDSGTSVEVRLETHQELANTTAIIRVTDSGPGVPEDALDKLFRPFYRIDDARGRETGGVGLGLAITERAVRLHGGTVRAANRPQGGLMVEIRLPVAATTPPKPPKNEAETSLLGARS